MNKLQAHDNLYFRAHGNNGFYAGTSAPPCLNETDVYVVQGLRTRNIFPVNLNRITSELYHHVWSHDAEAHRSLRHEALVILLKHVMADKKPDLGLSFKLANMMSLDVEGRLIENIMNELQTNITRLRNRSFAETSPAQLFAETETAIRANQFDRACTPPEASRLLSRSTYMSIMRAAFPNRSGLSAKEIDARRKLLERVTTAVNAAGYEARWRSTLTRGALGVVTVDHAPELFLTAACIEQSGREISLVNGETVLHRTTPNSPAFAARRVGHLRVVQ